MFFYFTNSSHSECRADLLPTQMFFDYQESILTYPEGLRKSRICEEWPMENSRSK